MTQAQTIRILVVDDQTLVRQGLATLLSIESDFEIVGQSADGTQAFLHVEQLKPDVVLMDLRMPICDGITAAARIREKYPLVKILALTTFDDDELIFEAIEAGASGYLLKDTPREQVAAAVRAVHQGNMYLGPTIAPRIVSQMHRAPVKAAESGSHWLTSREREVLKLIGEGRSNKEIAKQLAITEGTVKNHVSSVLTAIGARDRTQAALWAQVNL
jgi:DNA-binding NarL/FixJ family response regulator